MNRDKGIIRITAIILLIGSVIIYSLVIANQQTTELSNTQQHSQVFNTTNQVNTQERTAIVLPYDQEAEKDIVEQIYNNNNTQVYTNTNGIVQGRWITKISNEVLQENETTNQTSLPWTVVHIGGLASLQTLGIDPVYILKDQQEAIYYIPLGQKYDRGSIASRYNGNIKEIVAQTEIQANELRWDKITFINLPQYAGQLVLMVVDTWNQQWLLQIDYTSYHKNKQHMKQRFNSQRI